MEIIQQDGQKKTDGEILDEVILAIGEHIIGRR